MTVQKKILDLTGSQYLVQKVKSAINDVDSSLSTHIADTDIHVTTADKNKWNNQTYVFRYSSTALVASSTNSNALLDNTDNLKVGDKVIDSSGVLFSITAIDTANSTFTIGTALIDLAQDSDVMHKSGDETVGGSKTFSNDIIRGLTTIASRTIKGFGYSDTTGLNGNGYIQLQANLIYNDSTPSRQVTVTLEILENAYADGRKSSFSPNSNNTTNLGKSGKRWGSVYATNYYYGSSETEFSTKFVTTDTTQTISGNKTFEGVNINLKSGTAEYGVSGGGLSTIYSDKNSVQLAQIKLGNYTTGTSYIKQTILSYDSNNQQVGCTVTFSWSSLTKPFIRPDSDNLVSLGTSGNRWANVFATNYYYGSNNVEFSDKFVTTDTAQTISGGKTFSDNLTIYNPDDTVTPKGLSIRNAQWGIGESGGTTVSSIKFLDKNSSVPASVIASKGIYGQSFLRFGVKTKDSQNTTYAEEIYYVIDTSGNVEFRSWHDNSISLGSSLYKWKDVQTYKVNNLEPSSLSLPSGNVSDVIDISSYITALDGTSNSYTVPANGWISIAVVGTAIDIASSSWSDSRLRASSGNVRMLYPVLKNETLDISVIGTTLAYARFIPCQGNV